MNDMPAMTLRDRQIELEQESTALGVTRYQKNLESNELSGSGPGRRLLKDALEATAVAIAIAIAAWKAEADTGAPGRAGTLP